VENVFFCLSFLKTIFIGWAYYDSGANSEATLRENEAVFDRFLIRPRVLIDVSNVSTSCSLLGIQTKSPIYVSATALARLAHPDGEVAIVKVIYHLFVCLFYLRCFFLRKGCSRTDTIYMLPTLSSCSFDEMIAACSKEQNVWFQLYVNPNRNLTEKVIKKAESCGCKGLFVTVDAPQLGRRERDMRFKAAMKPDLKANANAVVEVKEGTANSLSSFIDPTLKWSDLPWLASISKVSCEKCFSMRFSSL
jgi:L-lactate dehydrogenase (cytochrome)